MKNEVRFDGEIALFSVTKRDRAVHEVKIDASDLPLISKYSWHLSTRGYAQNGYGMQLHRFIMNAPKGLVVDHLNGDRFDNRRQNLRITTQLINASNRPVNTPANVHFAKDIGRYRVRFYYNHKSHGFGCYNTIEEAQEAARKVRRKLGNGEPINGSHAQGIHTSRSKPRTRDAV